MSGAKNLAEIIKSQIKLEGPISLSTYMGLCLTHPEFGYYKNSDPLGKSGDFITAPEISQMFGEFIGLFIAQAWIDLGSPKEFNLIELGPGRGTLLQDAFRVFSKVENLTSAMKLILLETSDVLRQAQKEKLGHYNPIWIDEIGDIKDNKNPTIIIANEFFDALPIKQFQKQNSKWHERAIGIKNEKFAWGLTPNEIPKDAFPSNIIDAQDNSIWEVGFAGLRLMSEIAEIIASNGGAFLAIDYGYAKTQTGDTFQAVKNHQYVDALAEPGMADLTAHVDFEALSKAATNAGAVAHKLKTQGQFLSLLGINERSEQLIKANPDMAKEISAAKQRLISDEQMGSLFKVLCVSSKELIPFPFGEN